MTGMAPVTGHRRVVVVGGGQAGLAMSHCLKARGIDHLVLEKHRLAHEWREHRWDSFCLVTPNWQCQLPGFPYQGDDPKGFMKREEIVRYIEDYAAVVRAAAASRAWLSPGCAATWTEAFALATSAGDCSAEHVVVATGGYHTPVIPRVAERLPLHIAQLHSSSYRSPGALPEGDVLVVGTGQSGCQIAEDLHLAGTQVYLCVGSAPRTARRYRGRDVVEWLDAMGYYAMPVHEHPLKERVRGKANHYVTGRDGGRDIDLRRFASEGMRLLGRLTDIRDGALALAGDLERNLDGADAVAESIKDSIDKFIAARGIAAPVEARYTPVWKPPGERRVLDLGSTNIRSVIWCTGFRADYGWIELPAFDGKGYPVHERGTSPVDGLYFLGLPWLYTWGSGRFSGVTADANHLAERIASRLGDAPRVAGAPLNELALGS